MREIIFSIFLLVLWAVCFTSPAVASDSAWIQRIDALYNRGAYQSALEESDKYLAKFPKDVELISLKGWILSKLGETEKAEAAFDEALKLDSKWDNAYVGKGSLARKEGKPGKAKKFYEQALAINPDDAHCLSSMASLEVTLGDYKKAVELGEKAWELDTSDPTIAANLAIAYHYAGDHKKRDELFERAKELKYSSLGVLLDIFAGRKDIPVVKLDSTES